MDAIRWAKALDLGRRPHAKLVLLLVADYTNQEGESWPSLASLVRDSGLSRCTVRRCLLWLCESGYVLAESRSGYTTVYRVDPSQSLRRVSPALGVSPVTGVPVSKLETPPVSKLETRTNNRTKNKNPHAPSTPFEGAEGQPTGKDETHAHPPTPAPDPNGNGNGVGTSLENFVVDLTPDPCPTSKPPPGRRITKKQQSCNDVPADVVASNGSGNASNRTGNVGRTETPDELAYRLTVEAARKKKSISFKPLSTETGKLVRLNERPMVLPGKGEPVKRRRLTDMERDQNFRLLQGAGLTNADAAEIATTYEPRDVQGALKVYARNKHRLDNVPGWFRDCIRNRWWAKGIKQHA